MNIKNNLEIKILDKKDFTQELLSQLKILLDKSYFRSYMYDWLTKDLELDHTIFKAFIAFLDEKAVWIMLLEDNPHWKVNYHWFDVVHLQRVCVDSNYRNLWIWKKLLNRVKKYAFEENNIQTIFITSAELWAISFYIREWALLNMKSVEIYNELNSSQENIEHFKEMLNNKKFRTYRFANWTCVDLIYYRDEKIEKFFREKWYMWEEVLLEK